MSAGWEVNDNMRHTARIGLMFQVDLHGLDINKPEVKAFFDQLVETQAAMVAESIWLRGIVNDQMARLQKHAE